MVSKKVENGRWTHHKSGNFTFLSFNLQIQNGDFTPSKLSKTSLEKLFPARLLTSSPEESTLQSSICDSESGKIISCVRKQNLKGGTISSPPLFSRLDLRAYSVAIKLAFCGRELNRHSNLVCKLDVPIQIYIDKVFREKDYPLNQLLHGDIR